MDAYTQQPILAGVAVQFNQSCTQLTQSKIALSAEFRYSKEPLALFLVTPPHNTAYNIIISFLIDNFYNLNYETALNSGRKCFNRIHFILDEFEILPAINAMGTKVSIGLGQNILFDILV